MSHTKIVPGASYRRHRTSQRGFRGAFKPGTCRAFSVDPNPIDISPPHIAQYGASPWCTRMHITLCNVRGCRAEEERTAVQWPALRCSAGGHHWRHILYHGNGPRLDWRLAIRRQTDHGNGLPLSQWYDSKEGEIGGLLYAVTWR